MKWLALMAAVVPFGELPFQPVDGGAACLRATGKPGEVVRWVRGGVQLMEARRDGLVAQSGVALGRVTSCPVVASDANGAAVIAARAKDGLHVAVREPGGGWGPMVVLPASRLTELQAAVSPRGDAVLGWTELTGVSGTVRVARRDAGAAFTAPVTLASTATPLAAIDMGMTAEGETVIEYEQENAKRLGEPDVMVTTGRPGAPLAPARTLGRANFGGSALAVAADGRVLVAIGGLNETALFERPPGGDFAPLQTLDAGGALSTPVIALRPGGAAALGWQHGGPGSAVAAAVRSGPGEFAKPFLVAREHYRPHTGSLSVYGFVAGAGPPIEGQAGLRVTLGADGRALLVYPTDGGGLGTALATAHGITAKQTLGGPLREPLGASALELADGTRAVAWTDDRDPLSGGALDGRLHLAIEGTNAAPEPNAPRFTLGTPHPRGLRPGRKVIVPVRCSAACDVRISGAPLEEDAFGSLKRAGHLDLRVDPGKLELRVAAPGARTAAVRKLNLTVKRLPAWPFPHLRDVRVRRTGETIDVRWRTDVRARDVRFYVYGSVTRSRRTYVGLTYRPGQGRRSFHVRLKDAVRARYVWIGVSDDSGRRSASVRVPVR